MRFHLPPHLPAQPLSQVTAKQLRHWRDGLIKGGMLPATVNRMLKPAHAAFNLAAKLDPRVAANAQAWKVGLEALRGTVTARDAVLTDAQVLAVVAAAYDVSAALRALRASARRGRRALVATGAAHRRRSGQRDRLMVPRLAKGPRRRQGRPHAGADHARSRGPAQGRRRSPTGQCAAAAARRWRAMAAGDRRPPAHVRAGGARPPGCRPERRCTACGTASIARALLRSLPIKVVADWHDTSAGQIEAHYGRFIKHHYDDLVRAALLDTAPAAPADVVPLRRA